MVLDRTNQQSKHAERESNPLIFICSLCTRVKTSPKSKKVKNLLETVEKLEMQGLVRTTIWERLKEPGVGFLVGFL